MNIDDFINEIENTNKRFKTKQEEEFEKLTDRYKDIQHEVLKSAVFRDNMKEIISDVYAVQRASAQYFLAEDISRSQKISLEVVCERLSFDLESTKLGENFIKGVIYPTLLEFCSEVIKITKDKQE